VIDQLKADLEECTAVDGLTGKEGVIEPIFEIMLGEILGVEITGDLGNPKKHCDP